MAEDERRKRAQVPIGRPVDPFKEMAKEREREARRLRDEMERLRREQEREKEKEDRPQVGLESILNADEVWSKVLVISYIFLIRQTLGFFSQLCPEVD